MRKIIQVLFPTSRRETPAKQWCKCWIVEPRIFQKGDSLICHNCLDAKPLPPKIDLIWEMKKRQFLATGREHYGSMSREVLINTLLARDNLSFDFYRECLRRYHCSIDHLFHHLNKIVTYVKWNKPKDC